MSWGKELKNRARELRKKGGTYTEVCSRLGIKVPKGTLSGWFKNIKLSTKYYTRRRQLGLEHLDRIRKKALLVNAERKQARLQNLLNKNIYLTSKIDKHIGKLLLVMLYWSEGAKYPVAQTIKFGSSDPGMIRLFIRLLRGCYQLDEAKFRGAIHCRADQDVRKLRKFWSQVTGIPLSSFHKNHIDKRTIGKPTKRKSYKGVFVIYYFDTDLQLELQLLGQYLGDKWARSSAVEHFDGIEKIRVRLPSGPQSMRLSS